MVHNATRRWDDKVAANQNIIVKWIWFWQSAKTCIELTCTPRQQAHRILSIHWKIPYFSNKIGLKSKHSSTSSTLQVNPSVLRYLKLSVLILISYLYVWWFSSYGWIWEAGQQSPGQEHCKSCLMCVSEELFRELNYKIPYVSLYPFPRNLYLIKTTNSTTLIETKAFKASKHQPFSQLHYQRQMNANSASNGIIWKL